MMTFAEMQAHALVLILNGLGPEIPKAVQYCHRCLKPLDLEQPASGTLVTRLGVWCRACREETIV